MVWNSSFSCDPHPPAPEENAEKWWALSEAFEDDDAATIRDLYAEKQGVLDDSDDEVISPDTPGESGEAGHQADADLARTVEALPPVVYSAKGFALDESRFLCWVRTRPKAARCVYVESRRQRPPGLGGCQAARR